jgi:hypothetical protein
MVSPHNSQFNVRPIHPARINLDLAVVADFFRKPEMSKNYRALLRELVQTTDRAHGACLFIWKSVESVPYFDNNSHLYLYSFTSF